MVVYVLNNFIFDFIYVYLITDFLYGVCFFLLIYVVFSNLNYININFLNKMENMLSGLDDMHPDNEIDPRENDDLRDDDNERSIDSD